MLLKEALGHKSNTCAEQRRSTSGTLEGAQRHDLQKVSAGIGGEQV